MAEETKIPTNQGLKSIPEVLDYLSFIAYKSNREEGCTHEQLLSIGLGNDKFKEQYERHLRIWGKIENKIE